MSAITSTRYYPGRSRAVEAGGELGVLSYLKRFQRPLWVAFARGWNSVALIPEFRCGNLYKADFLLVSSMSGLVTATFIELEAPGAKLYTRNGTEGKELKLALRQVKDWQTWVATNPAAFREQIVRDLERLPKTDSRVPGHRRAFLKGQLQDNRIAIADEYAIVIGRRADLTIEDNRRRGAEARWGKRLEIVTYDRLLDIGIEDRRRTAVAK